MCVCRSPYFTSREQRQLGGADFHLPFVDPSAVGAHVVNECTAVALELDDGVLPRD
jgi:hypothetical protein